MGAVKEMLHAICHPTRKTFIHAQLEVAQADDFYHDNEQVICFTKDRMWSLELFDDSTLKIDWMIANNMDHYAEHVWDDLDFSQVTSDKDFLKEYMLKFSNGVIEIPE